MTQPKLDALTPGTRCCRVCGESRPGPHHGDALLELPHRNAGMGSAVGENRGIDGPPPGAQRGRVAGGQCAHRAAPPPWSQNGAPGPPKMGPWAGKTAEHKSYTEFRLI